MHHLTYEERLIFIFITLSLIIGLGVLHFKKVQPPVNSPAQTCFNGDITLIKQKVTESKQVNINQATQEKLCCLPGIGKVIAGRIIEYRKVLGGFNSKEEIMNVKGIGQKKFERIKDLLILK